MSQFIFALKLKAPQQGSKTGHITNCFQSSLKMTYCTITQTRYDAIQYLKATFK